MYLLALTHHNGIRIAELGFLLGAVAGALFALGATTKLGTKTGAAAGGVALAAGSVLLIVAAHWGHFG